MAWIVSSYFFVSDDRAAPVVKMLMGRSGNGLSSGMILAKAGPVSEVLANIIDQSVLTVAGDVLKNLFYALGLDFVVAFVQFDEGVETVTFEEVSDLLV